MKNRAGLAHERRVAGHAAGAPSCRGPRPRPSTAQRVTSTRDEKPIVGRPDRSCSLVRAARTAPTRLERLADETGVPVVVLQLLGVVPDALPKSARLIVRDHVGGPAWARAMAVSGAAREAVMVAAIEEQARADKAAEVAA